MSRISRTGTPPPQPREHAPAPSGPTSATEVKLTKQSGFCEKALKAWGMSIFGLGLYFISLFLVGWNEFRTVCTQKKLLQASNHVHDIGCTNTSALNDNSGNLVFVSCELDAKSRPQWGIEAFPNMGRLSGIFSEHAAGIKQVAQMFQCKETKTMKKSKVEGGYEKETIKYSYSTTWSPDRIDDSAFNHKYAKERENACGRTRNPKFPSSTMTLRAPGLSAGLYDIRNEYLEKIPIDTKITFDGLPLHFWDRTHAYETVQPPTRPSKYNAVAANGSIWTCDPASPPAIGCMRFDYYKASATHIHVLAELHEKRRRGQFQAWVAAPSWGCPAKAYVNKLEYVGFGTKESSHKEVLAILNFEDMMTRVALRALGVILAVVSIYLGLSPIRLAIDTVENAVRKVLRQIPFFGSALDAVSSFISGVASKIFFYVCVATGGLSALLVMSVVWTFMRPWFAIPLIAITAFALAKGALYIVAKGREMIKGEKKKY